MTPETSPPPLDRGGLSAALAAARADAGLTYSALAARSGVDRSAVIDIEMGRSAGSVHTWHRLAHALDIDVTTLLRHMCDDHH